MTDRRERDWGQRDWRSENDRSRYLSEADDRRSQADQGRYGGRFEAQRGYRGDERTNPADEFERSMEGSSERDWNRSGRGQRDYGYPERSGSSNWDRGENWGRGESWGRGEPGYTQGRYSGSSGSGSFGGYTGEYSNDPGYSGSNSGSGYSGSGYSGSSYSGGAPQSRWNDPYRRDVGWSGDANRTWPRSSAGSAFERQGYSNQQDRSGFSGRGPKGYTRSDERIREDVCDRLSYDDEIDASDISVSVKDGEVTLDGAVADRHAKHRAEDIADAVHGVRDVHNKLKTNKGFMQEVGERLMGREDQSEGGHSGSGTRNTPASGATTGAGATSSNARNGS
jgi:osmotically-inducible protein OsmY